MTVRGMHARLLAPGLSKVMFNWLSEHPEEYSQFAFVEPSDGAYDEEHIIAGLGAVPKKPEGSPTRYDDPVPGGTKRYIHEPYSLGWVISYEMKRDDRYGVMTKMPSELMKSTRQTVEQIGFAPLNLGSTTVTTIDGEPFFSAAHPLLRGGTYSNLVASDISITALQDILMLYENQVDEEGRKALSVPENLWIPPELQFITGELLQSSLRPDNAENAVNTLQGRLVPHVCHYFSSTTNWFVSGKNDMGNNVKMKWRDKPFTEVADDFDTMATKHRIYFRVSSGATHWINWAAGIPT